MRPPGLAPWPAKPSPFPTEILSARGNEEATKELRGKSEYHTAQRGIEDQHPPSGPRGVPPGLHRDHAELCAGVSLLSQPNQINVLVQSSTLGILAIGLAAVFFTGGMDLSLQANMAPSAIVGRGRAGGQGASARRQICCDDIMFVVAIPILADQTSPSAGSTRLRRYDFVAMVLGCGILAG